MAEESMRMLEVDGQKVQFRVERTSALSIGAVPSPDEWMLSGSDGHRKSRLAKLGTGQAPAVALDELTDDYLRERWRAGPV